MTGLRREPPPRVPATAGPALVLFPAAVGALLYFRFHWAGGAAALWGTGAVLGALYLAFPALRRRLARGFMTLLHPVGWTFSLAALLLLYYGLITPAGLLLRLFGRDPLRGGPGAERGSFWIPRGDSPDEDRYFRQF